MQLQIYILTYIAFPDNYVCMRYTRCMCVRDERLRKYACIFQHLYVCICMHLYWSWCQVSTCKCLYKCVCDNYSLKYVVKCVYVYRYRTYVCVWVRPCVYVTCGWKGRMPVLTLYFVARCTYLCMYIVYWLPMPHATCMCIDCIIMRQIYP